MKTVFSNLQDNLVEPLANNTNKSGWIWILWGKMEGARFDWIILTIILKLGYHGCISVSYDIPQLVNSHVMSHVLTLHSYDWWAVAIMWVILKLEISHWFRKALDRMNQYFRKVLVKVARANPVFRQESNVNDLIKALNEKTVEDSFGDHFNHVAEWKMMNQVPKRWWMKASERTVTSLNGSILVWGAHFFEKLFGERFVVE